MAASSLWRKQHNNISTTKFHQQHNSTTTLTTLESASPFDISPHTTMYTHVHSTKPFDKHTTTQHQHYHHHYHHQHYHHRRHQQRQCDYQYETTSLPRSMGLPTLWRFQTVEGFIDPELSRTPPLTRWLLSLVLMEAFNYLFQIGPKL